MLIGPRQAGVKREKRRVSWKRESGEELQWRERVKREWRKQLKALSVTLNLNRPAESVVAGIIASRKFQAKRPDESRLPCDGFCRRFLAPNILAMITKEWDANWLSLCEVSHFSNGRDYHLCTTEILRLRIHGRARRKYLFVNLSVAVKRASIPTLSRC